MSISLSKPLVFNRKWRLGEKIGEGANAEVFAVENDLKYAMKICPLPTGKGKGTKIREAKMRVNSIYWESQLYNGNHRFFRVIFLKASTIMHFLSLNLKEFWWDFRKLHQDHVVPMVRIMGTDI